MEKIRFTYYRTSWSDELGKDIFVPHIRVEWKGTVSTLWLTKFRISGELRLKKVQLINKIKHWFTLRWLMPEIDRLLGEIEEFFADPFTKYVGEAIDPPQVNQVNRLTALYEDLVNGYKVLTFKEVKDRRKS